MSTEERLRRRVAELEQAREAIAYRLINKEQP